jgi:Tol biopolymer transport system component
MIAVGSRKLRTPACAALAATLAAAWLCAGAFGAGASPPLMTYITDLDRPAPQVWVAAIGGGSAQDLGPASSALISPDGVLVAAVSIAKGQTAKTSTLSLYTTDGGTPVTILYSQQFIQLLAWSSDAKKLLVAIGASPAQLRVIDAATDQSHTIATGVIDGAGFAPGSSDQVVYARAAVNTTRVNIYTTSASGTGTRQLTRDGLSEYPVWGPHGIVYSHETPRPKNPYPALQLWFMSSSGAGAHQLTATKVTASEQGLTPIAFSANGKHLLANLVGPEGSDQAEAYVVDLSGPKPSAPRDLTGQGNGYIGDAISSDGGTILLTKGVANNLAPLSIETIPWAGGTPTTVIAQGAYASWDL